MAAHARLSPSGAARWMTCPASVAFEANFPDKSSEYARLGTLAHGVAEAALVSGQPPPATHPELDQRMLDCVREYVDYVRALPGDKHYEVRLKLNDDIWGTADCIALHDDTLSVCDLKTGSGVKVYVEQNPQLMIYGLMAAKTFTGLYDFTRVELHIAQPPLNHFDSWAISVADLLAWESTLLAAADLTRQPDAPYRPTEKACGFCRGKHQCRARADANTAQVQGEFADPNQLTDDEIAGLLEVAEIRRKWYADLLAYTLSRAEKGHRWPGFKLVEGRSNRKYADPDQVAERLTASGIDQAVIYERSLLGITDMEKAIGRKRFTELIGDLVVKPRGKPTLVPSSDPRTEIDGGASIDGFEIQEPA